MPKVITLTDIQINYWTLNVDARSVAVSYNILDSDSNESKQYEAVFWETIPSVGYNPAGEPLPQPEHWYQLPPGYVNTLTDLTQDCRSALLHLINE